MLLKAVGVKSDAQLNVDTKQQVLYYSLIF